MNKKTNRAPSSESAGSKLDKARELGVPVLDEAQFRTLLGSRSKTDAPPQARLL